MVIESSLMYLLPFFGTKPQSSMGIIITTHGQPKAIPGHHLLVSMVIPPELRIHFVGKPGTSFMDFNPPRVWVSLKKHVEFQKNLAKSEPVNDTKFGRFTSESLDESQWFPSDHQQTPEPIATATEMLPLWLGSQIQRPLQKKRKTVNVFWFL